MNPLSLMKDRNFHRKSANARVPAFARHDPLGSARLP
jgi:hypothetical protein